MAAGVQCHLCMVQWVGKWSLILAFPGHAHLVSDKEILEFFKVVYTVPPTDFHSTQLFIYLTSFLQNIYCFYKIYIGQSSELFIMVYFDFVVFEELIF